ncbi:hypothetical protein B5E58_02225 [Tyzzerella sp. An114]|uniref:FtsB family cell division protein n=1 Tax=Tyzzerella sp. An114 TaxID=1965545 RepID=UPI000B439DA7|nr:septum formation initiator family protein [Tyzzerella sp. An114]OUQ59926.1 hypothetical protein B5E58_02225 [Tyzzerella sp. An114]
MASAGKNSKKNRNRELGRYNRYTNNVNNGYNTTSVAYETVPPYYPDNNEDRQKKRERLLKEKEARAERIRNRIISFKFAVAVVFVFGCCILTMSSYARVVEKREQINNLKSELSVLQSENNALSAEIAEQTNLEVIEKEAIERLGMSKPQQYQTVYIDVPEQGYTIQYDDNNNTDTEEKFSISNLFSKALSIFKKD